jgi:UDP-glucose 4-epimerase
MKIFVSGGAGFIGSHYVHHRLLDARVERICVFDNFSSGKRDHIHFSPNEHKLKVFVGDLKDQDLLFDAIKGSNLVVHFAANPDISRAVHEPTIDFIEGTLLLQNVLEAMRKTGVCEILYISGSGVYGEVRGKVLHENFGPCLPISTYGASKLACEALISAYAHMFSLKGRVLRLANVVGPRQTHGIGYDFIRKLKKNPKFLTILGDGGQSKAYIHVDDVICALEIVYKDMQQKSAPFDIFNVSTDDQLTVKEIADAACHICGLKPQTVEYSYTGGDRGWRGDVPHVLLDTEKIRSLGWSPAQNSKEAIMTSLQALHEEYRHIYS